MGQIGPTFGRVLLLLGVFRRLIRGTSIAFQTVPGQGAK